MSFERFALVGVALVGVALLGGCSRNDSDRADAAHVLRALEVVRAAPNGAKRRPADELAHSACSSPIVCGARDSCAEAYQHLARGTEAALRVKGELDRLEKEPPIAPEKWPSCRTSSTVRTPRSTEPRTACAVAKRRLRSCAERSGSEMPVHRETRPWLAFATRASLAIAVFAAGCETLAGDRASGHSRSEDARAPDPASSAGPVGSSGSRAPEPKRLYVTSGAVDVLEAPAARAKVVGTVRAGGSIDLAESPVAPQADCPTGWRAVLPRGFVCPSERTTDDARAPAVTLLAEYRLAEHAALPASYGVAEVAPLYMRLPTWDEQLRSEPGLEEHLHKRAALREAQQAARKWGDASEARDADLYPAGVELPDGLRSGSFAPFAPKPLLANSPVTGFAGQGARVAWVAEFDATGRTWLVTPDLLLLPRDKVTRSAVSGFRGAPVPPGAGLAFVGHRPARRFRIDAASKKFNVEGAGFAPQTAVFLATKASASDDKFLATAEPGVYLRADEVIVVNPSAPARWGLEGLAGDEKWIEVDVKSQVLLLREGARTLFGTLVSTGFDTRPGKFRIVGKHLTLAPPFDRPRLGATKAEAPSVVVLSETSDGPPAAAFFAGWWMTSWGSKAGGFGVALSPLDARRVFEFGAPVLPEGWHSVHAEGTWVVVH